MPTREEILEKLDTVMTPGIIRSIVAMNLVRNVEIADGKVSVELASTALNPETQEWLKTRIPTMLKKILGVKDVEVKLTEHQPKDVNQIGKVIAIMSGKGGVGKSLVTGLSAVSLTRQGHSVGILDADITGPSIPKIFGISTRITGSDSGMLPATSRGGIEVMSINLFLPHEDDAVIWRGPLIGSTINQFWDNVLWGKLDYLVVDLPPGTSDATLTVLQALPLSGVVVVFSPQELAAMVVRKTVQMSRMMNIPILGVVENMSYLMLPDGKKMNIFGKSKAEEMAKNSDAPLLATIPIDPKLAELCDAGDIERYDADIVTSFGENLLKAIESRSKKA